MHWSQFKIALSDMVGVSQDALHVMVGVAIQLLVALILRRRVSSIIPWLVLLVIECANEWADLSLEIWPNRMDQWHESAKDLTITMTVPTILLLAVRFAPGLFRAGSDAGVVPPRPETEGGEETQSLED